ncbi:MAG TPA: PDDEXK nuclease domain-containing protein [bacterium]|nr:PDDEXK nuclease domain-containing protein [bacterium]
MNIEKLVNLFQNTHNELQSRAARSVDIYLVVRNWLFGWYIVEFEQNGENRAEYGKKLITTLSERLKEKGIKGVSLTNLKQFRQFFETYRQISQALPDQSPNALQKITQALPAELDKLLETMPNTIEYLSSRFVLGWTHYVTLMTVKNDEERRFYEIEAAENGWGYRELERQINSALFERLALSKNKEKVKELSEKGQIIEKPQDVIKNPFVLEFLNLPEYPHYSEHQLETAIIDKLEPFILELGKGFLFESRQKRFSFDNRHFYVDLVFYNRLLKCFVVIDLKIGDLKHQDLGQMQMYVNYFDRYVKTEEESPTVGILLCLTKSDSLVELTLPKDSNIYASNYQLYLPSKEELKKQIEEAEREFSKKK